MRAEKYMLGQDERLANKTQHTDAKKNAKFTRHADWIQHFIKPRWHWPEFYTHLVRQQTISEIE